MKTQTSLRPTEAEFARLARSYDRVPVSWAFHLDLETPLSAFLKLGRGPWAFLLESAEQNERFARYSLVGFDPVRVFEAKNGRLTVREGRGKPRTVLHADPFGVLAERFRGLRQAPLPGVTGFLGGLVGYAAYDCVRIFERLPATAKDELGLPDFVFLETDKLVLFDHLTQTLRLVVNAVPGRNPTRAYRTARRELDRIASRLTAPLRPSWEGLRGASLLETRDDTAGGEGPMVPFPSNFTRKAYTALVERCREYIRAGDVVQVVPSQRFRTETHAAAVDVYRHLRRVNPSPYLFLLKLNGFDLVGASPEMLLKVEGGAVETRPIAGTRPRGATAEEDRRLEESLRSDAKELAEHLMLVDLGRNDLGRVCEYGSVSVPVFQRVERYSHVMHLVSEVTGRLREGLSAFDAFRACFPAGTLTGAPKIRAMEIIEELEGTRRGPYGGAVGYFGYDGNAESAITIRTVVLKRGRGGRREAFIQAGGGVVADSDSAREYEETVNKAKAPMEALRRAGESSGRLRPPKRRRGISGRDDALSGRR